MTTRVTLNLPDALAKAVQQYRDANRLTLAAAAAILIVRGLHASGQLEAADADALAAEVRRGWGGQREGAFGRKAD